MRAMPRVAYHAFFDIDAERRFRRYERAAFAMMLSLYAARGRYADATLPRYRYDITPLPTR